MVEFLRRSSDRYVKIGKREKKKQKWRKPTGRDNKMREKRRGYPAVVGIGYRKDKKSRWRLKDKKPILVKNLNDLKKINKDEIAIIGKIGKKKKIEIIKEAEERKINFFNINTKKFLKKYEEKNLVGGTKNESK